MMHSKLNSYSALSRCFSITALIILLSCGCNVRHYEESGDYVLEKGGDLLWYNQPSGFFYEGKEKRTYLTWMDDERNVEVCYYDENKQQLSEVKKIKEWSYLDDHGQPVLQVMQNGKYKGHILVFLNLHNSPLSFIRSQEAENIEAFSEEKIIDSGAVTYPSIVEDKAGRLMVFYKKNVFEQGEIRTRALFYRSSDDGGDTWSSEKELLNFGKNTWIYSIAPAIKNDTIHVAFSIKDSLSTKVKDVFYVRSSDWGNSWETEKAQQLLLPIGHLPGKIYETPANSETRVWDLKTDLYGRPVIAFYKYNTENGVAYTAVYRGDVWNITRVSESENVYYPAGIAIDEKNPATVYTAENNGGGVTIAERLYDTSKKGYEFVKYISLNKTRDQVRPQLVKNYSNLKLLWVDVLEYKHYQNFKTNIKAYFINKPKSN